MKPDIVKGYTDLVREEAELVKKTQAERAALQARVSSLACESLAEQRKLPSPDTSKEQLIQELRTEMFGLLDLLMSAPENPNFKQLKFSDGPPDHTSTYNARRRTIEITGYGPLEVNKLYVPKKGESENVLITRLDVAGLSDISEFSLRNNPTIVEPYNHRHWPSHLDDPDSNELLRLQDELETLTDICEAAGLSAIVEV
jgi:hypothetical protein